MSSRREERSRKRLAETIERGLKHIAACQERKPERLEGFEAFYPMTAYEIMEFVVGAPDFMRMNCNLFNVKCFQPKKGTNHFFEVLELHALLHFREKALVKKVLNDFTKINGSEFLAALTKYIVYFCYRQAENEPILEWQDLFKLNTGREETWHDLFEQFNAKNKNDEVQTLMVWITFLPTDKGISRRVERAFDVIAKHFKTYESLPPCIHLFLQQAFCDPHNYTRVNKNSVDAVVWPFVKTKYLKHLELVSQNGKVDDPTDKPGQAAFLNDTFLIASITLGIRTPAERQFLQGFLMNPHSRDIETPSVWFIKYVAQYIKLGIFSLNEKDKLIAWNYYYDDRWCGYDRNDLFGREAELSEMFHYSQPFKKVGPINQHPHCNSLMICARLFGWMIENPQLYEEMMKEHGDETFVQYACIALSFAGMFDAVQKLYYEEFARMKSRKAKICLSINFMYACAKKGMAEACLNVWAYVIRKTLKSGETVPLELPSTPLDGEIKSFSLPPFVHHKYARHFAFRLLRNGLWMACVNGDSSTWSKYGLLLLHLCEHLEESFLNHNMVRNLMKNVGDQPGLVIKKGYTQAIRHLSTYNHILSVVAVKDPQLLQNIETPPLTDFKADDKTETDGFMETYYKLKDGCELFEEVLKDFRPDAFKTEPRIVWQGKKGTKEEGKVMYEGMERYSDDEGDDEVEPVEMLEPRVGRKTYALSDSFASSPTKSDVGSFDDAFDDSFGELEIVEPIETEEDEQEKLAFISSFTDGLEDADMIETLRGTEVAENEVEAKAQGEDIVLNNEVVDDEVIADVDTTADIKVENDDDEVVPDTGIENEDIGSNADVKDEDPDTGYQNDDDTDAEVNEINGTLTDLDETEGDETEVAHAEVEGGQDQDAESDYADVGGNDQDHDETGGDDADMENDEVVEGDDAEMVEAEGVEDDDADMENAEVAEAEGEHVGDDDADMENAEVADGEGEDVEEDVADEDNDDGAGADDEGAELDGAEDVVVEGDRAKGENDAEDDVDEVQVAGAESESAQNDDEVAVAEEDDDDPDNAEVEYVDYRDYAPYVHVELDSAEINHAEDENDAEDDNEVDAAVEVDAEAAGAEIDDAEVDNDEVGDDEVGDDEVGDAEVNDAEVAEADNVEADNVEADAVEADAVEAVAVDSGAVNIGIAETEVTDGKVSDKQVIRGFYGQIPAERRTYEPTPEAPVYERMSHPTVYGRMPDASVSGRMPDAPLYGRMHDAPMYDDKMADAEMRDVDEGNGYDDGYGGRYAREQDYSHNMYGMRDYENEYANEQLDSSRKRKNYEPLAFDLPMKRFYSDSDSEDEEKKKKKKEVEVVVEPVKRKDRRRLFSYDSDSSGCEEPWRPSDWIDKPDEPMEEPIQEEAAKKEDSHFDQPLSPDTSMVQEESANSEVKELDNSLDSPEEPEELFQGPASVPTEIPLEESVVVPVENKKEVNELVKEAVEVPAKGVSENVAEHAVGAENSEKPVEKSAADDDKEKSDLVGKDVVAEEPMETEMPAEDVVTKKSVNAEEKSEVLGEKQTAPDAQKDASEVVEKSAATDEKMEE